MKKNELIGRMAQKADISEGEAFEALAATFQALIDNLCGTVFTTISLAPDPTKPMQVFVDVPYVPGPHAAVDVPSVPGPHAAVDVPSPPGPHATVDVPSIPGPHLVRQSIGLVPYVAGRVGITSTAAATAIAVILEQIGNVAREAGIKSKP
jgi:hypothetical protein